LKVHAVNGWSNWSDVFSLVRASLSQKLNLQSEPTVDNVPCTGWKAMSFTYVCKTLNHEFITV